MENNHSEIIHAWVCGAEIQCKPKQNGEWKDTKELHLDSSFEYRVNPKKSKAYYKDTNHSEVIRSWVCGADIQCKPKKNGEWKDTKELHLDSSFEYRINPKRSKAYYKDTVNLGDTFWYISPYLTVEETVWDGSRDKLKLVECGNAFMSNEEAVKAIKAIRIIRRLF